MDYDDFHRVEVKQTLSFVGDSTGFKLWSLFDCSLMYCAESLSKGFSRFMNGQ